VGNSSLVEGDVGNSSLVEGDVSNNFVEDSSDVGNGSNPEEKEIEEVEKEVEEEDRKESAKPFEVSIEMSSKSVFGEWCEENCCGPETKNRWWPKKIPKELEESGVLSRCEFWEIMCCLDCIWQSPCECCCK